MLNANHIMLCGLKAKTEQYVILYALCLKSSTISDAPHEIQAKFEVKDGDGQIRLSVAAMLENILDANMLQDCYFYVPGCIFF